MKDFQDHQQITFVTPNGFCPLSTPSCHRPGDNIKLDGILTKVKWNYIPILYCISSFKGASYKRSTATCSFISCFTLAFKSADNFLELHSILFEKRFLPQFFLFQHSLNPNLKITLSQWLIATQTFYWLNTWWVNSAYLREKWCAFSTNYSDVYNAWKK